jgi:hypothetical protein
MNFADELKANILADPVQTRRSARILAILKGPDAAWHVARWEDAVRYHYGLGEGAINWAVVLRWVEVIAEIVSLIIMILPFLSPGESQMTTFEKMLWGSLPIADQAARGQGLATPLAIDQIGVEAVLNGVLNYMRATYYGPLAAVEIGRVQGIVNSDIIAMTTYLKTQGVIQ